MVGYQLNDFPNFQKKEMLVNQHFHLLLKLATTKLETLNFRRRFYLSFLTFKE